MTDLGPSAASLCGAAAVLAALLAAYFWARSAYVKLPNVPSTEEAIAKGTGIGMAQMNDATASLARALVKQGRSSARGAGFAALAAVLQALSLWLTP